MHEEYIKETDIREITDDERNIELIRSVIKTKIDLRIASKNFEYAEGELIDYYTYQIKANQSKLDYLVKKVKSEGIEIDMIQEIEIRSSREEAV